MDALQLAAGTSPQRSLLVAEISTLLCQEEKKFQECAGLKGMLQGVIELLKNGEKIEELSEIALLTYLKMMHQGIKGNKPNSFLVNPVLSNLLVIARSFLSTDLKRIAISVIVEVGRF